MPIRVQERTKRDLRWNRTERNLLEAFAREINEKPVANITVTALARAADMNKATFYLHYRDIFDLAEAYARGLGDEVVDDMGDLSLLRTAPKAFIERLIAVTSDPSVRPKRAQLARNNLVSPFADQVMLRVLEELERSGTIDGSSAESEIMVTFMMSGIMGTLHRCFALDREVLVETLDSALSAVNVTVRSTFQHACDAGRAPATDHQPSSLITCSVTPSDHRHAAGPAGAARSDGGSYRRSSSMYSRVC